MYIARKDDQDAAGSLQVCAGNEAGSEAAIHAIYDVYQKDVTEAILPVGTENAFTGLSMNGVRWHLHTPTHASIYLGMSSLHMQNFI